MPGFDYTAYQQANPDLASLSDPELLAHYFNYGFKEERLVNFNSADYLSANPDLPEDWSFDQALNHYTQYGQAEHRMLAFSRDAYLAGNPDLSQSMTYDQALSHWNLYGKEENRLLYFNAPEYLAANTDLPSDWTSSQALNHYLNYGKEEHRLLDFDGEAYLQLNPDVAAAGYTAQNAVDHYLQYGQQEGRVYYHDYTYNQAPVVNAGNDTTADAGQPVGIGASNGLNILDYNNDPVTVTLSDGGAGGTFSTGDTVTGTPQVVSDALAGLTYTPSDSSQGTDVTLTVTVDDKIAAPTSDTFTVHVNPATNPGETFILTTGKDVIQGGTGDDTVYGLLTTASGATTFQPYDSIDLGGGNNTFDLTLDGQSYFGDGNVKGVDTLNIHSTGSAAAYFYNGGFDGLGTLYTDKSSQSLTVSDLTSTDVGLGMKGPSVNGLTASYTSSAVSGPDDAVTVDLQGAGNTSAPGFEINVASGTNGVETLDVTVGGNDSSKLNFLKSEDANNASTLQTLNVGGDQQLTVTTDIDFAGAGGMGTIDASANTGGVLFGFTESNDDKLNITGGAGDDTFDLGTGLDASDDIDGGAGTDTLGIKSDTTVKMADQNVTNMENIDFTTNHATDSGLDLDGAQDFYAIGILSSGPGQNMTVSNMGADTKVNFTYNGNNVGDVKVGLKDSSGTTDTLNVGYDRKSGQAAGNATVNKLEVSNVETLNIDSSGQEAGNSNNLVSLSAGSQMNTLGISGDTTFVVSLDSTNTGLTTVDASGLSSNVVITFATGNDLALKGSSYGSSTQGDTYVFGDFLDNKDTITGGSSSADTLTANGGDKFNSISGDLHVDAVENIEITHTDGQNSTIDMSDVKGCVDFGFVGSAPNASGTVTIENFDNSGTKLTILDGNDLDTTFNFASFKNDSQRAGSDTLTVNLEDNSTGANTTDVALKGEGIANLNFEAASTVTVGDYDFDVSNFKANTINVTGGTSGTNIDFTDVGTKVLSKSTTKVDASGSEAVIHAQAAQATGTQFLAQGALANQLTGDSAEDTFTIGLGHAQQDISGEGGDDILNMTLDTGNFDTSSIDGIEFFNFTLGAGAQSTISNDAGYDRDTVKSITITGGSSSSKFDAYTIVSSTNTAALTTLDASGFNGQMLWKFDSNDLDSDLTITGGTGSDTVNATYDGTMATKNDLKISNVEKLEIANTGDGTTQTIDMSNTSGVTEVDAISATAGTRNITLDKVAVGTAVGVGKTGGNAGDEFDKGTLTVALASATGTADALTLKINDTNNAANTGATIVAAGIETLSVEVNESLAEHQIVSFANVAATGTGTIASTFTGGYSGKDIRITDLNADFASIEAASYQGNLSMQGRAGSTAMTINTGVGNDLIMMQNGSDAINAGEGTDSLDINVNAVVGSVVVDLSQTGDQIIFFNGTDNTTVQTGFINVDLTDYTGGNGAEITANAVGSGIVGSGAGDQVNGGAGVDTIQSGAGNDNVSGGDSGDSVEGGAGTDTIRGDAGTDTLKGDAGNDTIYGGTGADTVYGGADNDVVYGEDGTDTIYGQTGTDSILGGAGNDTIFGGVGLDTLIGGTGADTYQWTASNEFNADEVHFVIADNDAFKQNNILANNAAGFGKGASAAVDTSTIGMYVVNTAEANCGTAMTTGQVAVAVLGAVPDYTNVGANDSLYAVMSGAIDGSQDAYLYAIVFNGTGDGITSATCVAVFDSSTLAAIDGFTATNFDGWA